MQAGAQAGWIRSVAAVHLGLLAALACTLAAAVPIAQAADADARPLAREGRWLVDGQGRVVVMHGVNFVQKTAPFYTDTIHDQDARFYADEGFNTARVGMIWEGLEPQPGRYDDGYVAKVAAFDAMLARHGIRSLIDMHQDAYSASAVGAFGIGDGAPAWATLHGPLVLDDFQAFWDDEKAADGVGIQTHFVNAMRHLAASGIGASANVLGYDPFNEPYAGTRSGCGLFTPCPAFESAELAAFYRRVIAAIRDADTRHVIFPEAVAQNGVVAPALPRFDDPQTAFSFHFYCQPGQFSSGAETPAEAAVCAQDEQHGLGNFLDYARALEVPGFLGEFSGGGANGDIQRTVEMMGRNFTSWTLWAYQDTLVDSTKPASEANARQDKLDALVVPYAQAIAGTPKTWSFDRATRTMTLTYVARPVAGAKLAPGARTRIFVPQRQYPAGYSVSAKNARVVSSTAAPWVDLLATRPRRTVTVTVTPTG
jgi:endoglycosylceramidase